MIIFTKLQVVLLLLLHFIAFMGFKDTLNQKLYSIPETSYRTLYTIQWDETRRDILKVDFTTSLEDGRLFMAEGAEHIPHGWAHFIHNLKVETQNGKNLRVTRAEDGSWNVQAKKDEIVHVSYDFHLDHENYEWSGGLDGVAYSTDWGNFYTGRTVFVLNGTGENKIEVKFKISPEWKVTHPWLNKDDLHDTFLAQNQTDLIQSMFFIGKHKEIKFQKEGFELIFALGGEHVVADKDKYHEMAMGVLEYYTQLMGGLPKINHDGGQSRSIVIINEADSTDGEVIGNNISILVRYNEDPMAQMLAKFIFAHEFFHLWNGKTIVPSDERTEWFKEGFTNYYTLKALNQCGFLDDRNFLGTLNSLFYKRYSSDDGLGTIAMVEGEQKHDHWGLIYAGGLFISIAQDMIIRINTGNQFNLDDLMKEMYLKYSSTAATYNLEDLEKELSRLSKTDQRTFFNKYVMGFERIPIEKYLSQGPFKADIREGSLNIKPKEELSQLESEMLDGFFGKIKN